MDRKEIFSAIMTFFFLASLFSVYAFVTSNRRPEITVSFNEPVNVLKYNLTDVPYTKIYGLDLVRSSEEKLFVYQPTSDLLDGKYLFTIKYADKLGNTDEKKVEFTVAPCIDYDGDGYYEKTDKCAEGNDCNDANAEINPGEAEICGNGIDENCDGGDEKCPINLTSILINPKRVNMRKNTEFEFRITAFFSDGSSADISDKTKLFSNDSSTVAVTGTNKINALKIGHAKINANYTYNEKDKNDSALVKIPFMRLVKPEPFLDDVLSAYVKESVFDVQIETELPSDCNYTFIKTAGNLFYLKNFNVVSDDKQNHTIYDFNLTPNTKIMYVVCNSSTNVYYEEFNFYLITSSPQITDAYANSIYEMPEDGNLRTTIIAKTDVPAVCRYDEVASEYEYMNVFFDNENEIYALDYGQEHQTLVTQLEDDTVYTYYIMCKGLSGLYSNSKEVSFTVNTEKEPDFRIDAPKECVSRSFRFNILTTKKANYCLAGNQTQPSQIILVKNNSDYNFISNYSITDINTTTYYVNCEFGNNPYKKYVEHSITVATDTTAPKMLYVDDTSALKNYPEFSPYTDKLRVKVGAEDEGCGIDYFILQVFNSTNESVSQELKYGADKNNNHFYIENLKLNNATKYFVRALAIDKAGLKSNASYSNGVIINVNLSISDCDNGIKDYGETDIDCGGKCLPLTCDLNKSCALDIDCTSGYCNSSKVCAMPSCNDSVKNGNETDKDCGGSCDTKCSTNQKCSKDSDCNSNNCNTATGKCEQKDHCKNKQLDLTETDVDCGGECLPCEENEGCEENSDCVEGLICVGSTCKKKSLDSDDDGIPDSSDKCPDTKKGVKVDKEGCPYDSDNDGMPDKWEIENGLNPNDASDANLDPDKDKLSNKEEYEYGTDPQNADSDGDGFNDKMEIDANYDPNDPNDHPEKSNFLLIFLLLLVVLVGGVVLYMYYSKSAHKKPTQAKKKEQPFKAPPYFKIPEKPGELAEEEKGISPPLKKKESPLFTSPYRRETGLTPEMIAKIRAKVREEERKKLFGTFEEKKEEEKEEEKEEKPAEEGKKEGEGVKKEAVGKEKTKMVYVREPEKRERDVFKELEKLAERAPKRKEEVFEELKKIAREKEKTKKSLKGKSSKGKDTEKRMKK